MFERRVLTSAVLCALLLIGASVCAAQGQSVDQAIDTLIGTRTIHEVAISPDGTRVAWSVALLDRKNAPTNNAAIYIKSLRGDAAPSRVTAGGGDFDEEDFAWSPDGSRIAFLSDKGSPGQLQLYVADIARGGGVRKLTSLTGLLATPQWSPDGSRI